MTRLNHRGSRGLGIASGVLVAFALASPVMGQQRAGGDGRALDANPQAGSGGANTMVGQQPLDMRLRNTLVTGQAGGGQSLQIDAPYRSEFELAAPLGSDDLFRFQRDSVQSSPLRLDVPRTGGFNLGGGTAVFRPYAQAPVSAIGQPLPPQVVTDGGAMTGAPLRSPMLVTEPTRFTDIGAPRGALGFFEQPDGRTLEVMADPLLGVRQRMLEQPGAVRAPWMTLPDPTELDPDVVIDPLRRDRGEELRIRPPAYRPLLTEPGLQPDADAPADQDPQLSMGMTTILGRQLQGRIGAERADRMDPLVEQRMQRVGESLMNRAAAQRDPAESPYANLLSAVQDPEAARRRMGQQPTASPELDPMVEEEAIRRAEEMRAQALRRAFGIPEPDADAPAARTPIPGIDEDEDGPAIPTDSSIAELLQRLNYDLPPLQTLVGDQDTQRNQAMRAAEDHMREGRFFDAERAYRQVVQRHEDPLARIGMVHAQMGAGMIRSAALNLRNLFEQHPEMIAARYSRNLLPPQERLNWVRSELERMLDGEGASDAAIMLAYLGHQVGSRQLVRYGLATAEARTPRDPLPAVLRSIWLDQRPEEERQGRERQGSPEPANSTPPTQPADDNQQ
jgi:hypothetical protein